MAVLTKMASARRLLRVAPFSTTDVSRDFAFQFVRSLTGGGGFREERDTFGPIQVPNDR